MARNADTTRQRILSAATAEFAAHGIAGARVSRIAARAGVNSALLYRYFGRKIDLFDAVFSSQVLRIVDAVPLDPTDLPGYVGRLHDYYRSQPDLVRLTAWGLLERPELPAPDALRDVQTAKSALIARAQHDGTVRDDIPADEIRDLLSLLSLSATPLMPFTASDVDPDTKRATSVTAAAAVFSGGAHR
ncbi:TetR/AcrR family transcriptional regulator [Kutzneria sp. CA-103260]|uniref:TetR/AcrR family transcriptional regulator n=1 Tax=Kutzneria sp. CA-103260 TaxID=2802641 RepID=UPI001BA820EC|nr:TetR family transcriptional regulator [Kutzneria sp. CA-103260]QUQ68787.1 TetR family transcriptional regulator [Kutzneria sp. CA-103260]